MYNSENHVECVDDLMKGLHELNAKGIVGSGIYSYLCKVFGKDTVNPIQCKETEGEIQCIRELKNLESRNLASLTPDSKFRGIVMMVHTLILENMYHYYMGKEVPLEVSEACNLISRAVGRIMYL